MKKIIFGIVILLLLSWAAWAVMRSRGASPAPAPHNDLVTYQDPAGRFAFDYPSAFTVTGSSTDAMAKVMVPHSYMPGTNFVEAWLTVNRITGGTDQSCSGTQSRSDAAAGSRYDETVTKKLLDGDCYTLDSVIHYGNIQNYDPSQGVKEFDENRVKDDLNRITASFRSLTNSD